MIFRIVKRLFDIVSASLLLVIISPLFVVLMMITRIKLGSPVFFKQERSGKNKKTFCMIKFRSMTNDRDAQGKLLPDAQRLTKFGRFLRSSSLDELPELFSIIKGDMSVIGPRPLPPSYNYYYTEHELKRFEVRAGLIPPDSVEPSAIITWEKQFEYEANYAENLSLINDLKIFFKAIKILFTRNETDYGTYVRKTLIEERRQSEIYHK